MSTPKSCGPEAECLKIDGMGWGRAVRKALQKPMPKKATPARRKRK